MSDKLYLSDGACIEPLVSEWYAWPFMIAPAQAGLTMRNHLMRILESFTQAPDLHREAAKNPAMKGGPFMDFDGSVAQVEGLIQRMRTRDKPLLDLAAAIETFGTALQAGADGGSITPWYDKLPKELSGLVELGYDINNVPSMRLIEGLIYKSEYFDRSRQSLMFSHGHADERSFVLSTPRLAAEDEPVANIAFDSPLVDRLAAFRTDGGLSGHVDDILDHVDRPADRDRLRGLFHREAPPQHAERNFRGDGVRVRYFGHATVLFETAEVAVLTDAVVSYPVRTGIDRYTHHDLPDHIDYVLLTHTHQDHVSIETLLQLRSRIGTIVVPPSNGQIQDPSLKAMLNAIGFRNVVELAEMDTIDIPGVGQIIGAPFLGEHGDLHVMSKIGFYIDLKGKRFLCVADSNNVQPEIYDRFNKAVGGVDYLFMGMECEGAPMSWLYGPLLRKKMERKHDQARRLNGSDFEGAYRLVESVSPEEVFVYAMGQEPWLTYLSSIVYTPQSKPIIESDKLVKKCQEVGIGAERLFGQKALLAA